MIKALAAAHRSERERFKIPRSVQRSIPIQKIFRDGIWQVLFPCLKLGNNTI